MNYSKQREIIRSAIRNHPVHPTADELLAIVRSSSPAVSLATVYRNLRQLADEGEVLRIPIPGGAERFDGNAGEHYHLYCTECSKVYDIKSSAKPELSAIVEGCSHLIRECSILFTGICEGCLKNHKK